MWQASNRRKKWGGNQINGYFASAFDKYIEPFIKFFVDAVQRLDQAVYADDVAAFRVNMIFSDDFTTRFPRTSLQLSKISREFHNLDHSENWFNAANSCRELLKCYTTELYEVYNEDMPDQIKAGDVKTLLKNIVSKRYSSGRTKGSLLSLIQSIWDHTQCLLHREETNRDEASRNYLWVTLLISEIYEVVKST